MLTVSTKICLVFVIKLIEPNLVLETNGRSKGCGLVEYSTTEEAEKAIEVLNDTLLSGRRIFVREVQDPKCSFRTLDIIPKSFNSNFLFVCWFV